MQMLTKMITGKDVKLVDKIDRMSKPTSHRSEVMTLKKMGIKVQYN